MVVQGGCARMASWFARMRGRRRGWSEVVAELTMVERKLGTRGAVVAGDREGRGQCSGGGSRSHLSKKERKMVWFLLLFFFFCGVGI